MATVPFQQNVPLVTQQQQEQIYTAIASPFDETNMRLVMANKYSEIYFRYVNNYLLTSDEDPLSETSIANLKFMMEQTSIAVGDESFTLTPHIKNIVKIIQDLPANIYDPVQGKIIITIREFEDNTPDVMKQIVEFAEKTKAVAYGASTITGINLAARYVDKIKDGIATCIHFATALSARSEILGATPSQHLIRQLARIPMGQRVKMLTSNYAMMAGVLFTTLSAMVSNLSYKNDLLLKEMEDKKTATVDVETGEVKIPAAASCGEYYDWNYLTGRDNPDNLDVQHLFPSDKQKFEFYSLAGNTTNTGGVEVDEVVSLNRENLKGLKFTVTKSGTRISKVSDSNALSQILINYGVDLQKGKTLLLTNKDVKGMITEMIVTIGISTAKENKKKKAYIIEKTVDEMAKIRNEEANVKKGKIKMGPDITKESKKTAAEIKEKPKKPPKPFQPNEAEKKKIAGLGKERDERTASIKRLQKEISDITKELETKDLDLTGIAQRRRFISMNEAEIRSLTATVHELEDFIQSLRTGRARGGGMTQRMQRDQILIREAARLKREQTRAESQIAYREKIQRTESILGGPRAALAKEIEEYIQKIRKLPKKQQTPPIKELVKRLEKIKEDTKKEAEGKNIFTDKRDEFINNLTSFIEDVQGADQSDNEEELEAKIEQEFMNIGVQIREMKSTKESMKKIYGYLDSYALLKFNNNMKWQDFKVSDRMRASTTPYHRNAKIYNNNPRSFAFGV